MDHDDSPGLSVGFAVDTGGSFENLLRLEGAMDRTEGRLLPAAQRIEQATSKMVNLERPSLQLTTFSNAATRELQTLNREKLQTAKVGEALIRQLEREAAALGKTKAEMRDAKIEATALAASKQGNSDVADRLLGAARQARYAADAVAEAEAAAASTRATEAARQRAVAEATVNAQLLERSRLEAAVSRTMGTDRPRATDAGATFSALAAKAAGDEARAMTVAASAAKQLADEHGRLAAMVRGSAAAQEADTVAAERMRMSTDPLYAATKRLNAEIAESTRLYHTGATAPAEYARQQEVLAGRLKAVGQAHDQMAIGAKRGAGTLTQLSFQLNDVATMAALGAKPMQIFASQAGQIFQVAQMAEGGVKGFAKQMGGLLLAAAPVLVALAAGAAVLGLFMHEIQEDAQLKKYADGLGLTHKEMKKLGDVSITTGDKLAGLWKTLSDQAGLSKVFDGFGDGVGKAVHQAYLAFVSGTSSMMATGQAAYDTIIATWRLFPSALGDLVVRGVNAAAKGVEWLVNKTVDGINLITNGSMAHVNFAPVANVYAGAGSAVADTYSKAFQRRYKENQANNDKFMASWTKNTVDHAEKRLKTKADALIADRTPKTPKADNRGANLAREAEAVEAQITNLYKLADAYGVSGAAALIAEARVKAESEAIKKRGDIEEFVSRQVRLAVAQRVSDAGKTVAGMREQSAIQAEVNRDVAAGLVPAERANELVKDRMADLPLLQAMAAASARDDLKGANASLAMLLKLRAARADDASAQRTAQYLAAKATGDDKLADLREELRLVGETDAVRTRALAVLRATREAEKWNAEDRASHIAQAGQIADATARLAATQRDWNDQLTFTADKWDIIARNVQDAASGLANAFGAVGRAVGDVASIYANYEAARAKADDEHKTRIAAAGSEAARDREDAKYQLAISTRQVGLYGDMASAAKGFFDEKSKGYKALATAEKVFRTIEFALSVRAMAQDAAETAGKIASSVLRTAKYAVEAVVKAISSLPPPLNFAAGAATVAALAALGVSIAGGFGGGGGNKPAAANTGTGTVLGDANAKSESIKRAIDQLRDVDTLMLSHSREMAASLRSIDAQISGFAAQILKAGDINASAGVNVGTSNGTGKAAGVVVGGAIGGVAGSVLGPVGTIVGGIIGSTIGKLIGSLFGSKTEVTGSGLYGGAQSLGGILNGGFDASYYSDVKTKKFLGITTGTSYSTQYTGADPTLENQFTLILRSFNDAIAAAAGPLGESTDAIQQRLNGFVVNIGKIDLTGLTGEQVTEKLTAIFGKAADEMAGAAFPGVAKYQKAGEGLFETAVRVASTLETVGASLDLLAGGTRQLSMDAKLGIADQFDSLSALASAADGYFKAYYTSAEQAAGQTARFATVFDSLGMAMPETLAGFRSLVEAQDLTTAAGQSTYATLLQLAPAFADLKSSMTGVKSAADITSERMDLERQMLELRGDTAAIRALDLAKLDVSNRALQQQVWAVQDAQKAADAADQLRQAWTSVGDTIETEIDRIRGLSGTSSEGGFAVLQGRFNAASLAARGGDQDAAKLLPGLSQAMLAAAAQVATSRQELSRVEAMTAASLAATKAAIDAMSVAPSATSTAALLAAAANAQAVTTPTPANDTMADELRALREEVAAMRSESRDGHAATASAAVRSAKVLENVSGPTGGDAVAVRAA